MFAITLKQMHYFSALARSLHFGRAAEAVNISQPALSAQIADMEAKLGYRLFERRRSGIAMTPQARALQPRVERILAEVKDLEDFASARRGVLEGRFRLGIIPTVAPYLLPKVLPAMRQAYRSLELELKEAVTETLLADLDAGRLDAIILALPVAAPGIESHKLFDDRFLLAVCEADLGELPAPASPDRIDPSRLLLLDEGHCLRDQALKLCGSLRPRALASCGATSLTTIIQMVGHGMGVTLIPEIAVEAETRNASVRVLPFTEPTPGREVGIAWRKGSERSADFAAMASILRRHRPRSRAEGFGSQPAS